MNPVVADGRKRFHIVYVTHGRTFQRPLYAVTLAQAAVDAAKSKFEDEHIIAIQEAEL